MGSESYIKQWFTPSAQMVPFPEGAHRRVALWDVTRECDLRCAHCYNYDKYMADNAAVNKETSTEEALRIIDKLAAFGFNQIHFLGGEPLNRPDCLRLFSHASSKGLHVTINTNGIRLTPDMLKGMIDAGVEQIAVSLDGSDEESNDRIRGKGTFRRITKNLEQASSILRASDKKVLLAVICTMTRPLIEQPEKVGAYFPLLDRLGLNWLYYIFLYRNSKALDQASTLAYPMSEALQVLLLTA